MSRHYLTDYGDDELALCPPSCEHPHPRGEVAEVLSWKLPLVIMTKRVWLALDEYSTTLPTAPSAGRIYKALCVTPRAPSSGRNTYWVVRVVRDDPADGGRTQLHHPHWPVVVDA